MKHALHVQFTFSVSLRGFEIIKQKGINTPGFLGFVLVYELVCLYCTLYIVHLSSEYMQRLLNSLILNNG
jgi:uncharacterized membrane protein YhdT